MFERTKERLAENWRRFRGSEPGSRFQDRYYRRRENEKGGFDYWKVPNIAVGVGIMLAGLFMVIFPGPGWLTFFLGLGVLGGEFRPIARFLDWLEVRARKLTQWALGLWAGSHAVKALILLTVLSCTAALGYGAYHLISTGYL